MIKSAAKGIINTLIRSQKIAVLHTGRCGSTVLGSMLDQHTDFYWSGEIFNSYKQKGNTLTLKQVKDRIRNAEKERFSKIYSFETKYSFGMHLSGDCINMSIPDYIDLLYKLGYSRFILLYRKNYLKRVISIENGRQTGKWHSKEAINIPQGIYLDPYIFEVGIEQFISLEDYFEKLDKELLLVQDVIGGDPLLILEYENDIEENPLKAYSKVCDFAGINAQNPEIQLKKTNPFPVNSLITNYNEVAKALLATPYAWMLHE